MPNQYKNVALDQSGDVAIMRQRHYTTAPILNIQTCFRLVFGYCLYLAFFAPLAIRPLRLHLSPNNHPNNKLDKNKLNNPNAPLAVRPLRLHLNRNDSQLSKTPRDPNAPLAVRPLRLHLNRNGTKGHETESQ